uniref:Putative sorting nexin n=1 Tax=Amblyomma triste TaxID=251400 RepID=A0A023GCX1_AMBTT
MEGRSLQAKVLYDFEPQAPGEIGIWANETVTIINKNVGEGWVEGINSRGETGLFPEDYVEMLPAGPPPPSVPPPPLPPKYDTGHVPVTAAPSTAPSVQYDNGDDWDDDWDDDDSNQGAQDLQQPAQLSGPCNYGLFPPNRSSIQDAGSKGDAGAKGGTVKRFNRFSNFVKSGGESWLLGLIKPVVPSDEQFHIVESEGKISWATTMDPYYCEVSSPKKESKFKGFKNYIAYQLTPSFNQMPVSRRYKHFDWLHERLQEKFSLIPVPPLPDKQISGRYQDDFIEHRMAKLQLWVNRICQHPVMSQSSVWMHFLTCRDEKKWKMGKRKAEKDELMGTNLFAAFQVPQLNLDPLIVEGKADSFSKFTQKMDDGVNHLYKTSQDQIKKCSKHYKYECEKIASSLKELANAFDLEKSLPAAQLTEALKHTEETYKHIGSMYESKLQHHWESLGDLLFMYKGVLAVWPDILSFHKTFLSKHKEYQKMRDEVKLSQEDLEGIRQRMDVVSYAMLAEVSHFQQQKVHDFNGAMHDFLGGQISFYEEIVKNLKEAQGRYMTAPQQ